MIHNNRIAYFDIAKAILIICLLYSHATLGMNKLDIDDCSIPQLRRVVPLFGSFYMQAFFIITGLCSSYKRKFLTFLWKNLQTLIFPALILGIIFKCLHCILWGGDFYNVIIEIGNNGLPWFIMAMFISRLIYFFLAKLSITYRWILIGLLYILGLILNEYEVVPNILFHRHALLMLPYLAFGQLLKNRKDVYGRYLTLFAILGVLAISIQWIITQIDWHCFLKEFHIPSHDDSISFGFIDAPLHIFNSVTGSAVVLKFSKILNSNKFFETIGYGSLFVYLSNGFGIYIATQIVCVIFTPMTLWEYAIVHVLIVLTCVFLYYPMVKLVYGSRYLSWMVGK